MTTPIKIPDEVLKKGLNPYKNTPLRILLNLKGIDFKEIYPTFDAYDFSHNCCCHSDKIKSMKDRDPDIFISAIPNRYDAQFTYSNAHQFYDKFINK